MKLHSFIGEIVQGNQIGIILPKPAKESEQIKWEADKRLLEEGVEQEYTFYFNPKQNPYFQRKYRELVELAVKHTPEYVLADIWGEAAPENEVQQKEFLIQTLKAELGYTKPCIKIKGGRKVMDIDFISTSTFTNDEFAVYYARFRDHLFDYCKRPRIRKVNNEYKTIEGMTDFELFEAFGCLYLGFEMKHIIIVEMQLGDMDVAFHNSYLHLCKLNGAPLTAQQIESIPKQ
jgi:hypothetical protein